MLGSTNPEFSFQLVSSTVCGVFFFFSLFNVFLLTTSGEENEYLKSITYTLFLKSAYVF